MTKEQNILLSLIHTAINKVGVDLEHYDESKLLSLSLEQGVAPLVMAAAQWYKERLDTKVFGTENVLKLYAAVENQKRLMQQKKQVSQEFASKLGMPCVILKGLDYCRFWPKEEWRGFGDLDIYGVSSFKIQDSGNVYEEINKRAAEIGCRVNDYGYYKHDAIYYKNLMIENHQFLTKFDGTRSGKILEKAARKCVNEGQEAIGENMIAPGVNFTALYVLLHAHQHLFHDGISLKQILDWNFFLIKHEKEVDWKAVIDVLEKAKVRGMMDLLTEFCVKYFGLRTSLQYVSDEKKLEQFCDELFMHERNVGKFKELLNRYRLMWRFRSFNGENLFVRIKNTLLYNKLHKMPEL